MTPPLEEKEPVIENEALVPAYTLPEPLRWENGAPLEKADEWSERRAQILELFEEHMFGRTPSAPVEIQVETRGIDKNVFNGKATRKLVSITARANERTLPMNLLLYIPNQRSASTPAFLGLNFTGNHGIHSDPGIPMTQSWVHNPNTNHRATDASRGIGASRWQVESVLERGYAQATMYYGDIDPDYADGFQDGLHPLFYRPGQTCPEGNEWGAIGVWAWGLSRAMDYLLTDPDIDGRRVAVHGHSRLGKTALWAGAKDQRFALVISNNSGCAGAALSRRRFGETVGMITDRFGYQFCENFKRYSRREDELPFDQHMLIALVAPRPVYIASAAEDLWADPRGEFLAAQAASPVYRFLGVEGMSAENMPGIEQPVMSRIGYHIRHGKHDVTLYDWKCFMDFADRYMK
jgi:hypothetical protein